MIALPPFSRKFVSASSQGLTTPALAVSAYPVTMAAWFCPVSDITQSILSITGGNDTNAGYLTLIQLVGGTVRAQIDSGDKTASIATTTATVNFSQWNHAVAVFASSTSRTIYLNGRNSVTDTSTETYPTIVSAWTTVGFLGPYWNAASGDRFFDGYIALPAIWNTVLNDGDVMRLAQGELPFNIRPQNLYFMPDLVGLQNISPRIANTLHLTNSNASTLSSYFPPRVTNVPERPHRSIVYFASVASGNQSISIPLASISVAAHAPTINQTRSISVPASNITVAAYAPTVNRTQSITVPAAGITVAANTPTITQQTNTPVSVPAAGITVAALAPTINRTQSINVPVSEIVVNRYAPTVTVTGVLSSQQLAELYGGNIFTAKGRKKKKKEKPPIEEMVFAVAVEPEGKKELIRALPRTVQQEFDVPELALVSELTKRIEEASGRVQKEVERIYRKRVADEDEDDIMILLM